ncbi:hypothetical protein ACKC6I_001543 [Klebsiella pneumoniae]|nr:MULTISPECIES: hypothetical protein [Klebsiella]DAL51542.1 MAG TPA_asm: hypothetical protein [Caudoviricetes sp.]EYB72457.1 hypothetical protein KPB2_3451 [Klebsiella pneumoniae Kb677]MCF2806379.1 hypothetical protein [Klebsiella pneumoniae]MCF2809462.1 hypothetical protein [Klebsiella pneumoniae]MCF2929338.1 hypothetical protein [Klebsiella pneumoniae]
MSNIYSNTTSYKSHAQFLSYLMCGIYIASIPSEAKDNLLSGPIQRTSISGSQNLSSYKQLMPSTTPTISLYKSDESTFNDAKFASVVSNFYGTMLSNQITLGNEIESVIAGSLWDIYVD